MNKIILVFGIMALASFSRAQDSYIADMHQSPYATMTPVPLQDVKITKGFWAERQKVNNEVSFKVLWERANDPDAGHVIQNFEIAAGRMEGEFKGTHWQDAWLFKWMEAAVYILANEPDKEFEGRKLSILVDEMIELIGEAQQEDGYIATQITERKKYSRFENMKHHELYTMGHMYTAAAAHYDLLGKTNFLEIAEKCATYIYNFFSENQAKYPDFPNNPSIIMGAMDLYRVTENKMYLDMANHFIDSRGKYPAKKEFTAEELFDQPSGAQSFNPAWGRINNQNLVPLRESKEVLGHAVFYTYLYAGATDAYIETNDNTLWDALDLHWHDLTEKKMYVTGGVSPHQLSMSTFVDKNGIRKTDRNDYIGEGIARPYDLPQANGYNETCGMLGNMMWNWRMLQASGEGRFADIMELNWFNSILCGVDIDGVGWSYGNPLRWYGDEHELIHHKKYHRSLPGPALICCPTNILRNVAAYGQFLYGSSENTIWVNNYAGNELNTQLPDGTKVKMKQETNYPWNGKIKFTLESKGEFVIKLRVPYWAEGASVTVNSEDEKSAIAGEYVEISKKWKKGDVVGLNLPMEVKMLVSEYKMEQTRGQVAIKRGPVVYCLESPELPEDISIDDLQIPSDAKWETEFRADLLGGVNVLKTKAELITISGETIGGFQELEKVQSKKIEIELIPYYAWKNRGENTKMSVWLPLNIKNQ